MTARPRSLDAADFLHGFGRKVPAGVETACGIDIGSEQNGRGSPRWTWLRESVSCPLCLAGVRWPMRDDAVRVGGGP